VKGNTGDRDNFENKGKGNNKRDVFVFAFFLFLSFIFWYLNSLNKEVEAGIKFPVKYTNIPRARSVIDKQPVRLNLYLKGSGSTILKLKLSGKKLPVAVDLSKVTYKRVPGSNDLDYYIVTTGLTRSISSQLRSGCEITSIKPDTLFFTLGKSDPGTSQATIRKGFLRRKEQS
jgi:hypothetical protein